MSRLYNNVAFRQFKLVESPEGESVNDNAQHKLRITDEPYRNYLEKEARLGPLRLQADWQWYAAGRRS